MNISINGQAKLMSAANNLLQNMDDVYEKNKEAFQKGIVTDQFASEVVRALEGVMPELRSIKSNIDVHGYNSSDRRKIAGYTPTITKLRKHLSTLLVQA